jgi:dihydroorotase
MQLLIKKATIIHPDSPHNGQQMDVLIKDGIIAKIGKRVTSDEGQVIDSQGIHISAGWLDVGVQVCDPGYEHREDLESVAAAAMAGGFTGIATQPNTDPTVHSKSQVLYLKNNTRDGLVDFYPMAAVSQDCEGKDITEMIDMYHAGAVAFTDGENSIQDNGMMMRALQYVKTFDGLVINHPHDKSVATGGQMHEGMMSTSLGMKGIPNLSEDLMVVRDLFLAEYTNSKLHLSNISTAYAVDLVRRAKRKGVKVTASVAALNLAFTDA